MKIVEDRDYELNDPNRYNPIHIDENSSKLEKKYIYRIHMRGLSKKLLFDKYDIAYISDSMVYYITEQRPDCLGKILKRHIQQDESGLDITYLCKRVIHEDEYLDLFFWNILDGSMLCKIEKCLDEQKTLYDLKSFASDIMHIRNYIKSLQEKLDQQTSLYENYKQSERYKLCIEKGLIKEDGEDL